MVRDTDSFNGILIRTYTCPTMTQSCFSKASKASKILNLLSSHGFFQAQNAPKSVFGRPGPRWGRLQRPPRPPSWWGGGWLPPPQNPTPLSALWASIFGPSGLDFWPQYLVPSALEPPSQMSGYGPGIDLLQVLYCLEFVFRN